MFQRGCFGVSLFQIDTYKLQTPKTIEKKNTISNKITTFWHKSLVATPVASMKSHADSLLCWCKSTKLYIPNVLDIVPERYLDAPILVKLRKFFSNFLSGVYIYCWFKKELRASLYNNCNLPFYKTPECQLRFCFLSLFPNTYCKENTWNIQLYFLGHSWTPRGVPANNLLVRRDAPSTLTACEATKVFDILGWETFPSPFPVCNRHRMTKHVLQVETT